MTQGCWKVGYTGANPGLYQIAKNAITAILAKIAAEYPGATIRYWITWLQGEADGSSDPATYATELDAVLTGIRTHIGQPTAPIAIGGMVPEYLTTLGRLAIRNELALTQSRLEYVSYVDGVVNGGGSQNVSDRVHYGRAVSAGECAGRGDGGGAAAHADGCLGELKSRRAGGIEFLVDAGEGVGFDVDGAGFDGARWCPRRCSRFCTPSICSLGKRS